MTDQFVGRSDELGSLEQKLVELDLGRPGAIAVTGEPGIGKTRLLKELAERAEARGHLVLSGAASELEHDLPLSMFVDALDEYLGGLEPDRLAGLSADVQAELAHVFPSLADLASGHEVAPQHERYRSYRAIRQLLERLAERTPLLLVLDDVQWADAASIELLWALLRRPPATAVLLALAVRLRQAPERLSGALERAHREAVVTRIELGALTFTETRDFLGGKVETARVATLYEQTGGNPFYLQQLARALERPDRALSEAADLSSTIGVPPPIAAALTEELAGLTAETRLVLEGAAVAGDPFEPELVAAAAETPESSTIDAIDQLLQFDLIRTTDVPRRFRFRHPLVRRAVYETAPAGWRLGAHERCAQALAERGAAAAARAHHIDRSAREGDLQAVALLREAGEASARLAPESAARWFGGALRLLAQTAAAEDRAVLQLACARALAAAGHFSDSYEVLLEATAIIPEGATALRVTIATTCARVERFFGRYEQAHARLEATLRDLPEPVSPESVGLLIELTLNEFYRSRYAAMHDWAGQAVSAAKNLGDPALMAAALAMPALADAVTGRIESARSRRVEGAAAVDALTNEELSERVDAASWLAAAELYLDLYEEADAHASRALSLARASGGDSFGLYQILPRVWYVRGKLDKAAELLDGAIEAARLLGTPPALAGNLFNRSVTALAVGDVDMALATAEEAFQVTSDLDEGFVTGWAALRLAAVFLETAQPARGVELLLDRAGGRELTLIPGSWRVYGLELLTRGLLALDRTDDARRSAGLAASTAAAMRLPLAAAWADRSVAAVALHDGDSARAIERALASAEVADQAGAPIESALSRTLAGRALVQAGQGDRAVIELQRAAAAFEGCGALRYRQSAERELGKLGHRPYRRTRQGTTHGIGISALTERELQVARLVVDRKTNHEIAEELFLSQKTVESHLRNIFRKMDVATRVALARAVERADRTADV